MKGPSTSDGLTERLRPAGWLFGQRGWRRAAGRGEFGHDGFEEVLGGGRDLASDQLQTLTDRLRPALGYLHKLIERMEAEGFAAQGKLYRAASEAEDRLRYLLTVLLYLGCGEVTGHKR